jgi:hypothetical protein
MFRQLAINEKALEEIGDLSQAGANRLLGEKNNDQLFCLHEPQVMDTFQQAFCFLIASEWSCTVFSDFTSSKKKWLSTCVTEGSGLACQCELSLIEESTRSEISPITWPKRLAYASQGGVAEYASKRWCKLGLRQRATRSSVQSLHADPTVARLR